MKAKPKKQRKVRPGIGYAVMRDEHWLGEFMGWTSRPHIYRTQLKAGAAARGYFRARVVRVTITLDQPK